MPKPDFTLNVGDVIRENVTFTMRVTGTEWASIRLKVGAVIIKLGAWVAGIGYRLYVDEDK